MKWLPFADVQIPLLFLKKYAKKTTLHAPAINCKKYVHVYVACARASVYSGVYVYTRAHMWCVCAWIMSCHRRKYVTPVCHLSERLNHFVRDNSCTEIILLFSLYNTVLRVFRSNRNTVVFLTNAFRSSPCPWESTHSSVSKQSACGVSHFFSLTDNAINF